MKRPEKIDRSMLCKHDSAAVYKSFSANDKRWIKRFERVMKDAPGGLFMFVGAGSVVIYSERRMDGGEGTGVNQKVPNVGISTKMECDGGDW